MAEIVSVSSYLSHKKSAQKLPTHTVGTEPRNTQSAATDCNTDHNTATPDPMEVEPSQPHVHVHDNVQTLKSRPPAYGFDLNSLLAMGEVWLVPRPHPHNSLQLPRGFWEMEGDMILSQDVTQQIEDDLNWQ